LLSLCYKDGECKPADVAAHIKKRMADKAAADKEVEKAGTDDDSGMYYCIFNLRDQYITI